MRGFLYFAETLVVIALAYWAYNENYATQAALNRVKTLQIKVGSTRETLGVLRAEWAYLNRPDRLRDLADMNFESLRLMPLTPDQFGDVQQVIFPQVKTGSISNTVDLSAAIPPEGEPLP